jgi:NB-ARC domain
MDAHVREPSMRGAISGQVAVGRYVVHIGQPYGALICEGPRAQRTHTRPRSRPILLGPRLIRGLVGRQAELAALLSALDAGVPVEISGEPGIGKTAVLRYLAHHPRAASFVDGIVYLPARHQSSADLQQQIFEAFYDSDEICKPTETEIRRGLQEKRALILLDDVHLGLNELEQVLDIAPRSAFVVVTRERRLWGEVRSLTLTGLPSADAVLLLERELERPLDITERSAALGLCAAMGGHPLRIRQAAAIFRERATSLDGWASNIAPESLITEWMASIDEKQRRALLALAALPGVPLHALHVAGIAELPDIEPSLMTLVRRGLVVSSQSRHQLADGVGDRLRRTEDLKPWLNRAITYYTAWVERYRRKPDNLLEESEALLRVQQYATDARRWGEALRLGQLLEGALVAGARWGAWALTLEHWLTAAKAIGDRSAEAWALHEIGVRAVCLGQTNLARSALSQALNLREALHDDAAASASRRNLSFVLPPVSDHAQKHTAQLDDVFDLGSLPLRDGAQPTLLREKKKTAQALPIAVLLFAIASGLAYSWSLGGFDSYLAGGLGWATAAPATATPQRASGEPRVVQAAVDLPALALSGPPTDRANILIFTPRPGSITTGGPTKVCYAVSGAVYARVEPGIGDVNPTSRFTCLRVAPLRTTTYELTALGRGGDLIKQQLVIVVR